MLSSSTASVRLDIRRIGAIKEAASSDRREPAVVGNRTRVKVVKNKMAPPFREVDVRYPLRAGHPIAWENLLDMAAEDGIVEKSGAWYAYGGDRIGQGRDNATKFLLEHMPMADKIRESVLVKHGLVTKPATPPATAASPVDGDKPAKRGTSAQGAPAKGTN